MGDRHVIECLRKGEYAFGGENSGHLIFADYSTTGDGILSALQVLRLMRESGLGLAALSAVMTEYPSELVNLRVASKPPLDSLPKLQALMRQATEDFGDQGRHLIRYSGTEHKIRILIEHRDEAVCKDWIHRWSFGRDRWMMGQ